MSLKNNIIRGISKYSSPQSEKNLPLERIKEMSMRGNVSDYICMQKRIISKNI